MLDQRAGTVHAVLDLLEKFQPGAVMLENVVGFVQGRNAALPVIEERIREMRARGSAGYTVHWRLEDAAVFGVPQHRRRVIMIIAREDMTWKPFTPRAESRNSWDAIGDLTHTPGPRPTGKWTELLPSIPEGGNYQWLTEKGGGDEVFGYRTKYWHFLLKLAKNKPSWTLSASPGPSTGPFHWLNRPLSVREAARLQSFPDDWEFVGSERVQMKQVGNATPPLLAETYALQLRAMLDPAFRIGTPTLAIQERTPIPDPDPPRPIPESYRGLVGPKTAHAGAGLGPGRRGTSTV
jgi:DNA (cytosine-5)-methyltransferase 1